MQDDGLAGTAGAASNPSHRYLVQVWREAPDAPWRGMLRDVVTGQVRRFRDLDEILAFLGEGGVVAELLQDGSFPEAGSPGWIEEKAGASVVVDQDHLLDTAVGEIFARAAAYPDLAGATLLEATVFPSDETASGAARALLRAAAAAILCASHPDVTSSRSYDEIVRDVDAALASGDPEDMLDLARRITSEL